MQERSQRIRGRMWAVAIAVVVVAAAAGATTWWQVAQSTTCRDRVDGADDARLETEAPDETDLDDRAGLADAALPAAPRWVGGADAVVDVDVVEGLVVVLTRDQVVAVDTDTGEEQWRASFDLRNVRGLSVLGDGVVAYGYERVGRPEVDVFEDRLVFATWTLDGAAQDCAEVTVRRRGLTEATLAFAPDGVALLEPSGRRLRWLDAELEERWALDLPDVFARVEYGDGQVVVGSPLQPRENPAPDPPLLLAIEAASGDESWRVTQGAVDDLRLDTSTESTAATSTMRPLGVGEGLAVASVLDFVDLEGSELPTRRVHHVAAFDVETGERRWATATQPLGPGEELTLAHVDARAVVVFRVYGGIGFDLADGTLLWEEAADLESFRDFPRPVALGEELLVGGRDRIDLLDPVSGRISPVARTTPFEPQLFAQGGDTLVVVVGGAEAPRVVVANELR